MFKRLTSYSNDLQTQAQVFSPHLKFSLLEQIQMNSKRTCWYTELADKNENVINLEIIKFMLNSEPLVDRFKVFQIISRTSAANKI